MIKKEILQAVSQQIKTEFKGSLGRCQRITERAQVLLAEHGIDTTIVKGEAAFRVGNSELANVAFVKQTYGMQVLGNADNLFHYWLKDDTGRILDFTTYTLRGVIAATDRAERIKKPTKVTWCPDYLYVKNSECVSLHKIRYGNRDKMFFYKPFVEYETEESSNINDIEFMKDPFSIAPNVFYLNKNDPNFNLKLMQALAA